MGRWFLIVIGSAIAATGISCAKHSPPATGHLQLAGFEQIRNGTYAECA